MSTESFSELFENSLSSVSELKLGGIVPATVVGVDQKYITVNAGLKSESRIPAAEFRGENANVGDVFEVVVDALENGFGETRLSREKARRGMVWSKLEQLHRANTTVVGVITEKVKGGFTVDLESVYAFLPGSLIDVKPIRDTSPLEGKELEFKIIKMDRKRNNIVVSRRAVLESATSGERSARLDELEEGQEITGVVKNITDYGAFIDLGGADGLLHITDMAWKRVKHPQEVFKVGDEIKVKVLKFDREKNRVSLGMKQLGDDPWINIERRYPVGTRLFGRVTNVTDYGCFVEIEPGVEGLVHMSEMDWTNKNIHPSKVVQPNAEIEVMVLEISEERRRISLGIKQCLPNPWKEFSERHQKDEKVKGKIRSITDFGIFVGLEGDIDGLVHLSDISWAKSGEEAVRQYQKGDEVEAVILAIDAERERISLGIKQLENDPLSAYLKSIGDNLVVEGVVAEVDAKKATLRLADNVLGVLKASDYAQERTEDLSQVVKVGDTLRVKLLSTERKGLELIVSRKALEGGSDETQKAKPRRTKSAEVTAKTTLGDLLKEQMQDK